MRVLILFSSRHGHTRRIAEFIASGVCEHGWEPDVRDVETEPPGHLTGYAAALLVASIHYGRHAKRIVAFARNHHQTLDVLPSGFVSVSMTQASVDSTTLDPQLRRRAHEDLSVAIGHFIEATGWHPRAIHRAAGALQYTRYGWFTRWVMKRIAKSQAGSTDTSRDHEYTDWDALERFVGTFMVNVAQRVSSDRFVSGSTNTSSSAAMSASTSTGFVR